MNVALVFGITLAVLFMLAFITKRRFGVLGLALAAGAMLSSLWAAMLTPYFSEAGIIIDRPPLQTVVAIGLVLLPAVILLFSGPSYKGQLARVGGAACFAVLAAALLIEPLGSGLVLTGQSKEIYQLLVENRVYVVTAGLVIALIDVLGTHSIHTRKYNKKH